MDLSENVDEIYDVVYELQEPNEPGAPTNSIQCTDDSLDKLDGKAKQLLRNIKIRETSKNSIQCQVCPNKFATKVDLYRHMFVHRDKTFPCQYCNKSFTFVRLHSHVMKSHSLSTCNICDDVIENQDRNDHNRGHSKVEHITFKYNNDVYIEKRDTIRDVKIRNKDVSELIKCHLCDNRLPVQYHLKMRLLNDSRGRVYKCEMCERTFKVNYKRRFKEKDDQESNYNKIAVYKCDLCNLIFSSLQKLDQHLDEKHAELNYFECKTCNLRFPSLEYLKSHNRGKHATETR